MTLDKKIKFILLFLVPSLANADGGGILLAMFNPACFISGNLFVILIKYLYFLKVFQSKNKFHLLIDAIKINLISFLIGTILFSIIISLISFIGYDSYHKYHSNLGGFFFALGTGIGGDNSPFALLAIIMLPAYFLIIYLITVHIEYRLMIKYGYNLTIKQSFIWNFISYSFLAIYSIIIMIYSGFSFSWLQLLIYFIATKLGY